MASASDEWVVNETDPDFEPCLRDPCPRCGAAPMMRCRSQGRGELRPVQPHRSRRRHQYRHGPTPAWFQWEQEAVGLMEMMLGLGGVRSGVDVAALMMALGIAPLQAVRVEATYACGVDYNQTVMGEGWSEFDWHVLEMEPLAPDEIAERWGRWWDRYLREEKDHEQQDPPTA